MSNESIQMFLSTFKQDEALKAKLYQAKTYEEVASIAKEAGFEFDLDELKEIRKQEGVKLTDDELDGITGGNLFGIDLCENRYNFFLCELTLIAICPHFRKEYKGPDGKGNSIYVRYCDHCKTPWREQYTLQGAGH
ncbi:Nif11-like leader peptide family natural product precursor [Petroclostridium sp. X23]|uniref:Nif11-like leader peptide family natural product precursor n=1 Tax=Petroclostridium sp. X23 TaxID=3045146 RepID=UPI0024ACD354|nr:Nif11-like leader peptide family natural product precursor [Petroclostridium sp. X23]WHH58788.1 Nif11-like leader peptide family natural product precursor [Petroclostridium sp. X23]